MSKTTLQLSQQAYCYQIKGIYTQKEQKEQTQMCIIKYESFDWVNELIIGNVHNAYVPGGCQQLLAQNTHILSNTNLAHENNKTKKGMREITVRKFNKKRKHMLTFIMIAKM